MYLGSKNQYKQLCSPNNTKCIVFEINPLRTMRVMYMIYFTCIIVDIIHYYQYV